MHFLQLLLAGYAQEHTKFTGSRVLSLANFLLPLLLLAKRLLLLLWLQLYIICGHEGVQVSGAVSSIALWNDTDAVHTGSCWQHSRTCWRLSCGHQREEHLAQLFYLLQVCLLVRLVLQALHSAIRINHG